MGTARIHRPTIAQPVPARSPYPAGVRALAGDARAAGASEAQITEAVEVGYLFCGTAAVVMDVDGLTSWQA